MPAVRGSWYKGVFGRRDSGRKPPSYGGKGGTHSAGTAGKGIDPMTYAVRFALALACSAVVLVQAGGALACSCPKEQLMKKYGTVSQLRPLLPLPPPLPPAKAGPPVNG